MFIAEPAEGHRGIDGVRSAAETRLGHYGLVGFLYGLAHGSPAPHSAVFPAAANPLAAYRRLVGLVNPLPDAAYRVMYAERADVARNRPDGPQARSF